MNGENTIEARTPGPEQAILEDDEDVRRYF